MLTFALFIPTVFLFLISFPRESRLFGRTPLSFHLLFPLLLDGPGKTDPVFCQLQQSSIDIPGTQRLLPVRVGTGGFASYLLLPEALSQSGDERWGSWLACAGVLRRRMTRRRKGSSWRSITKSPQVMDGAHGSLSCVFVSFIGAFVLVPPCSWYARPCYSCSIRLVELNMLLISEARLVLR